MEQYTEYFGPQLEEFELFYEKMMMRRLVAGETISQNHKRWALKILNGCVEKQGKFEFEYEPDQTGLVKFYRSERDVYE